MVTMPGSVRAMRSGSAGGAPGGDAVGGAGSPLWAGAPEPQAASASTPIREIRTADTRRWGNLDIMRDDLPGGCGPRAWPSVAVGIDTSSYPLGRRMYSLGAHRFP